MKKKKSTSEYDITSGYNILLFAMYPKHTPKGLIFMKPIFTIKTWYFAARCSKIIWNCTLKLLVISVTLVGFQSECLEMYFHESKSQLNLKWEVVPSCQYHSSHGKISWEMKRFYPLLQWERVLFPIWVILGVSVDPARNHQFSLDQFLL